MRTVKSGSLFEKAVLRMMPEWASDMPEGKLIAAIMATAWSDLSSPDRIVLNDEDEDAQPCSVKEMARSFFLNETGLLERYCNATGLDHIAITQLFLKHMGGIQ